MMRRVGSVACGMGLLLAILVMVAAVAGAAGMEPVETEDGLFKLKVMDLHDNHGVTEVTGKIVNNSGQDYKTAIFTLIVYRPDGDEATRKEVEVQDIASGALKVFRVDVDVNILTIAKFGIVFDSGE